MNSRWFKELSIKTTKVLEENLRGLHLVNLSCKKATDFVSDIICNNILVNSPGITICLHVGKFLFFIFVHNLYLLFLLLFYLLKWNL